MTRQQKILAILFFLFSGVAACRVFAFGLVVNAYGPCESRANGQLACLMYDGDNAHAYTFSGSMPLIMVMDSYIGTEADTNACALLDIDGC